MGLEVGLFGPGVHLVEGDLGAQQVAEAREGVAQLVRVRVRIRVRVRG